MNETIIKQTIFIREMFSDSYAKLIHMLISLRVTYVYTRNTHMYVYINRDINREKEGEGER